MSKRKFKIGDRVVIKPTSVYSPKNTVGTVIEYNETKYTVKFTNGFIHPFRGVELDAYVEEPKKEEVKFKVGDKIEYKYFSKTYNGVVVETNSGIGNDAILCRLEDFHGHCGNGHTVRGKDYDTDNHWYCRPDGLKKIEEPKNTIVIYQRDRDVVAFDKTTGQKCYAHCHPDDAFDFKTGAIMAFDRLMGRDAHKGEEPVMEEKEFEYLKKFEQGKKYVFDKEIYKSCYEDEWCPAWVDICDGRTVGERTKDIGRIDAFLVTPKWCREVVDDKETTAIKEFEDLLELLKKMF